MGLLLPALLEPEGGPPIPAKCQAAAFPIPVIANMPVYNTPAYTDCEHGWPQDDQYTQENITSSCSGTTY